MVRSGEAILQAVGDGRHRVGSTLSSGTYCSTGRGTCYWARLSSRDGGLGHTIANGRRAPEIVSVDAADAAFETRRCGRWVPLLDTARGRPQTQFGDATNVVGLHIEPGHYRPRGRHDNSP